MRKYAELYSSPRCGDMWGLGNGCYVLVDFVDYFVGITYDNGTRVGFPTRHSFEQYIRKEEGVIVSRWEDGLFTDCCDNGFSPGDPISKQKSYSYIYDQLTSGMD